ncbi:MAG: riboflavin biosynthesis protein RibF [Oscillospiraceae bacterium]|nr:riboflavin biosynthesis protein RibF [Oscillospiraceae bacterium]
MLSHNNIDKLRNTAVALGYFDGVHMGHRKVIETAVSYAKQHDLQPAVFTFRFEEGSGFKGKNLLSLTEKQYRMELLGIEHFVCPSFNSFCSLTPQQFVEEILQNQLGAKAVFCGSNFTFGKNAAGNVDVLKQICQSLGIYVLASDLEDCEGDHVSSTRIRAQLKEGNIPLVNELLTMPYAIDFTVQHGKQLGRTLGLPTINQVYTEDMLLPRFGIYITRTCIDGTWYPSATGLGKRPTVNGETPTCETFITGYTGNLYGKKPRVEFYEYLCEQKKFDTLEELKTCIKNAALAAENYFKL